MAFLESIVVELTSPVPVLSTWYQRYVQSALGVYDVTDRSNVSWVKSGCINVRFFDPDGLHTPLYTQPTECDPISVPIGNTTTEVRDAYTRKDFSIRINGYDVVLDLGFVISGLFDDNGDPIAFTDFQPGFVYVYPEVGMFMFFHYPDKWDNCSYWDMAWWDSGGLPSATLEQYPYVSNWDEDPTPPPNVPPGEGVWWDNINNPIQLNTYWDMVSEAPGDTATVVVCYWTKDNTDPIANSTRSHLYTSPITISTDTQIRYRHVDLMSVPGPVFTDTYEVGLRLPLEKGVNLVSQPRLLVGPEAELSNLVGGLNLQQVFRMEDGLWQVYIPGSPEVLNDFSTMDNKHGYFMIMYGADSFCIPYGSLPTGTTELTVISKNATPSNPVSTTGGTGTGCTLDVTFYVNDPTTTERASSATIEDGGTGYVVGDILTVLGGTYITPATFEVTAVLAGVVTAVVLDAAGDYTVHQGSSAIGVPRRSTEDNSIANLLISRDIDFDELYRVTNGIFETYIVDRAAVLNFSPADLTPGRGYGFITKTAQTFELPFID